MFPLYGPFHTQFALIFFVPYNNPTKIILDSLFLSEGDVFVQYEVQGEIAGIHVRQSCGA